VGPINLADYEALARERMDPLAWDYFAGGSDDEATLRANRLAFERIQLRPRVLVDVTACQVATSVLETPVSLPILVAPTAYQALAHPEGECAMARGAALAGTLMIASTLATCSLEDVAAAAPGPLWFQLYVYKDRRISEALVRRAEAAGYRALVVTVDTPRLGNRERDVRNHFALPPHLRMRNFVDVGLEVMAASESGSGVAAHATAVLDPSLTWEALDWLRAATSLPVVLKGIMTAEDAALAVTHGAAGIIVSNHGGRQLDGAPATIEVLPEVVAAVAGGCEVYLDGGVRRGTDVLKALALGARAVLIGRPALWGLAAAGADGVGHVLEVLRGELELAMALTGRPALASLDGSVCRFRAW
jgi:4-hydroxymandelate oxidase